MYIYICTYVMINIDMYVYIYICYYYIVVSISLIWLCVYVPSQYIDVKPVHVDFCFFSGLSMFFSLLTALLSQSDT